jgi:hypothetical protein
VEESRLLVSRDISMSIGVIVIAVLVDVFPLIWLVIAGLK